MTRAKKVSSWSWLGCGWEMLLKACRVQPFATNLFRQTNLSAAVLQKHDWDWEVLRLWPPCVKELSKAHWFVQLIRFGSKLHSNIMDRTYKINTVRFRVWSTSMSSSCPSRYSSCESPVARYLSCVPNLPQWLISQCPCCFLSINSTFCLSPFMGCLSFFFYLCFILFFYFCFCIYFFCVWIISGAHVSFLLTW